MSNQKASSNFLSDLYLAALTLFSIAVWVISALNFRSEAIDIGFFVVSAAGILFSPYLRIQLPRTKIHFTVSDILIFYILLIYGSGAAVFIGTLEMLYMSINFRRRGVIKTNKTILVNVTIVAISTYLTASMLNLVFVPEQIIAEETIAGFGGMLIFMAGMQFLGTSLCISLREALRAEKPFGTFWEVWFKYCVNVLVMFIAASLITGLLIKAHTQLNSILFLLAFGVSALVYMTYRRYVDDVRVTSAKAEQAERERAEQAERHVEELQHHIAEQDRIGQALRESKEKFRHAAFHDSLTDLPNRNLFMETLKFALEKSRHDKKFKFAVLFLDINRFKTINDSLGHSMGDRLILHVARRLAGAVRDKDLVARFSGDEFAFILNNVRDVEDAMQFADRIKDKISEPFSLTGKQVFTSFSIGIAMGGAEYEAAEDVLRDADIAMYHAKDGEKDYVVFDQNMHIRAVTLLQLETDLRTAIERDELVMYYQPIINLDSMQLFGFESLIRWNHPTRGLVPPSEFIPVSEQTGFIIPLTLWVLRTSCEQMVKWQRKNPANKNLVVSVNLSGKHFAQKNLVEQIQTILAETGIKPSCVKLELTESAVMENAESVIAMMKQIRDLGIQLSIDDFGTGYSSLSYLHRFPINTLKVDRSFVNTMEDGTENGEIVRTVIALAKTLRLDVIAEGIETIHQLHQLRILGCEYGQGYLFSRPVPAAEAEKLIEDKSRFANTVPHNGLPIPTVEVSNLQLIKQSTH
ncbi:MAG: EAL domain-containing protein [Pyrinomonadaceae bacterium]|nr:EAL domain-containing protein [Pyrinomonadaceae bacterium]